MPKWIDIETQRSHDQKCYQTSKAMTRLQRHDQTVPREIDGAVPFDDVLEECRKKFDGASQWSLEDWISTLARGGGAEKRFQCWNPNFPNQFLYFRAIQGHSGDPAIDPELQDNVLLPEGFTEYIYHVGNASEMNSINRSGLIPGGRSLKRGRQSVFFTITKPMGDYHGMGETSCDLTKPRIAPYKNTWKPLQNEVYWCNLKLAQERGLQFYQTRSHAIVLYNTLPAVCIEKAVCMKTQEELYQKVRLSPRVPRVVLKANSHSGQQHQRDQDARSSWDPPSESKSYRETWNNAVDYRIPGITPFDSRAADYKTPKQGQSHQHKESFLQDLSQTQKINKFSNYSKGMIADLNNTEIFELCKNSSKQQCLDCNAYRERRIIYCSCGRNTKSSRSPTQFDQNNRDVTSIPGYVTKKNSSRGAKHEPSARQ